MPAPAGRGAALLRALQRTNEVQVQHVEVVDPSRPPSPDQFEDARPFDRGSSSSSSAPTSDESCIKLTRRSLEEPEHRPKVDVIKRYGKLGSNVQLQANFIALDVQEGSYIYEYTVEFDPGVDHIAHRYDCITQSEEISKAHRLFNGSCLMLPQKLQNDTYEAVLKGDIKVKVILRLKGVKSYSDPSCLRLYKIILNRSFKAMNLYPVRAAGLNQRSYFDPVNKKTLVKHGLEIWPGYLTNIGHYDGGVYLIFDSCNKVVRTQTVADAMAVMIKKQPQEFNSSALKALVGQSIITRYNNKTYRIDNIDFDRSPLSSFDQFNGTSTTFIDYYKNTYGVEIKDQNQPLLVHFVKRSGFEEPIEVCLIPELCFLTGLTDAQKADFKVMRDVSDYTRLKPAVRQEVFNKFLSALLENKVAMKFWEDWGLKLSERNLQLTGRVLGSVTLNFGQGYAEVPRNGDWGRAATSRPVHTSVELKRWALIYPEMAENAAKSLLSTIREQAPKLGIQASPPKVIKLQDDRTDSYIKAIRDLPDNGQLVMTLFSGQMRADRYGAVKKLCCLEKPVASQVIMQKTLSNPKRLNSVVQKVALQINCKLGGQLWGLHLSQPLLMVVGIQVAKAKVRQDIVVGVVASLNDSFGQFYSEAIFSPDDGAKMINAVAEVLKKAIVAFQTANEGHVPKSLMIFRDGINSGIESKMRSEALQLSEVMALKTTKVTFVVVQRRTMVKIMTTSNANPVAGTVVDHTISSPHWNDFYLIPMNCSLGTVSPTHFTIILDEADFEPDMVQRIAYAMTHMYFNWTGNVKVPAVCQYGTKLVDLVSTHLSKLPSEKLSRTLFYL